MRLFLYEYASAQPSTVPLPESVRREGRAMFDAVLEDARKLEPPIDVITLPPTQDSALSTQHYYCQADYALIIAPEFDGILEQQARMAIEAGCQLLGPWPEAIRLTADKWALHQHWLQRGVLTPATWLPTHTNDVAKDVAGSCMYSCLTLKTQKAVAHAAGSFGVPSDPATTTATDSQYLIKHRFGAGCLGVQRWAPGHPFATDHLLQEYIEGMPLSLAFLITPDGEATPLLPCLQHVTDDDGFEYRGGSVLQEPHLASLLIEATTNAVQNIPGLQGYIGVDAIIQGEQVYLLEINPRLTTSYLGLRQMSRVNLLEAMLQVVVEGMKVPLSWNPEAISWSSCGSSYRL